jgi:UDP-glucose 4-epimerase
MRERGIDLVPVARNPFDAMPTAVTLDISAATDWRPHLANVDLVVHLAARAHRLKDRSDDPLRDYRSMNVDATLHLARQCAQAGVKRLIYLSSIKVNGESTLDQAFRASDASAPRDPYAVSKWEAERGLTTIAGQTGLEVVIIRPPLVYGPGVKANFLEMMRWVRRGIPLPLTNVRNRRSMLFVGNLVDLILCCAVVEAAAGQTFLASDGHDVSSAELIRALAHAMGKKAALFAAPPSLVFAMARLLGRGAAAERLSGSLQVDIRHTRTVLGWTPPFGFEAGIALTVEDFLETCSGGV